MASIGQGVTISFLNGSVQTALSGVTSISLPGITLGEVDVTHLGSTRKEYLPTIEDSEEITIEQHFDGTEYDMLNDLKVAKTSTTWTIDFGAETAAFTGWVKSITPNVAGVDQLSTMTTVVKCNSTVTIGGV